MTNLRVARFLRVAQSLQPAHPPQFLIAVSPIGLESIRSLFVRPIKIEVLTGILDATENFGTKPVPDLWGTTH